MDARVRDADVVAVEARIDDLHDLARRVERSFGTATGRRLREAADLVASAVEDMRCAVGRGSRVRAALLERRG
ncbi:MAG TPA: hypothetical protein VIK95_09025 [Egibacteraceae bacterium]